MPKPYLLLFRNTAPETHAHLSADERQQLIAQWNAWFVGLRDAGKATDGRPLEPGVGRTVAGADGSRVTDGPFIESKEAIGGYVMLNAEDLDEATAIAQQHPGLKYGLIIEVRPLDGTCHLGVVTGPE